MNRLEHPDLAIKSTFHGTDFVASKQDIEKACGKTMFSDDDINEVTQHEWEMQTEDGTPFTIYDWKEYREISDNEKITWHIGSFNRFGSAKAYKELQRSFHLHPKIEYNI